MLRIGEVATTYGISNRTIRYWEDAGLIVSSRMDNGYRYYDNNNVMKIKQIILLRKLNLPIQDIYQIYSSSELSIAVSVLANHLENTKQKAEELNALSIILKRLIVIAKSQQSLTGVLNNLEIVDNPAVRKLRNALQITLSERKTNLNSSFSSNDVRIVNLPNMVVASYAVVSDNPEYDCWVMLNKLILDHKLHEQVGFRHFGFGFNNEKRKYGYEMWVIIPQDFQVPKPFERKEITGGLYAAVPAYLPIVGERWDQLNSWVEESDIYIINWCPKNNRNYLEECIDYFTFSSPDTPESKKQLDLLLPIAKIKKDETTVPEVVFELEPKRVTLPKITLGGCNFIQKENTKLWNKKIPWYKLANSIYKSGDDWSPRIKQGNNTFTLAFGDSPLDMPFYLAKSKGYVSSLFAAVEITNSFQSYPNELEERDLASKNYLIFSTWISPEKVGLKKLKSKPLYIAAAEYIEKNNCNVDPTYYLEREYRKDGKHVDKIELYIPLIIK